MCARTESSRTPSGRPDMLAATVGTMASTKVARGRGAKNTKKRPRLSNSPLSSNERDRAREMVRVAADLLHEIGEDLDDATLSAREQTDLRFNIREVESFVVRSTGGAAYARNRRWSLLYEMTKAARDESRRLSAQDIARLPPAYAGANRDAIAARSLLAKSVAARTRREWLDFLVEAIAEVEANAMGHHNFDPEAFEATILAHRRVELRVLGVSDAPVRQTRRKSPQAR